MTQKEISSKKYPIKNQIESLIYEIQKMKQEIEKMKQENQKPTKIKENLTFEPILFKK